MDCSWLEQEATNAEWQVLAGQRHIDVLRHHIERLERAGYDSSQATVVLGKFEMTQQAHVHYRDGLLARLGRTVD